MRKYLLTLVYRGHLKPPILIILVLGDRYKSLLFLDTKKVPVAFHFTSQWRNDVRVTKTEFYGFSLKIYQSSNFRQKSYEYTILMEVLANYERKLLL